MASRIHVVGLGVERGGRLNRHAEAALRSADVIVGSERQQAWLRQLAPGITDWPGMIPLPKLSGLENLLAQSNGEVAVLASGDPLFFGIGRWLCERFSLSQLRFHGAVSSLQAACSRLGLSLQDCDVVSLHGRPTGHLKPHLRQGRTLLILTDRHSGPEVLVRSCREAGLHESRLWVCERLGYEDERIHRIDVENYEDGTPHHFDELHVSVVELRGENPLVPSFPGLPDISFVTDGEAGRGMISKREVRLQILSLLQLGEKQTAWDIGAGCGGVATELALWHPGALVFAVEQHPDRLACIDANRKRFGVPNLRIVAGRAPDVLATLPNPERIFIGGSDGELSILIDHCWRRLAVGGVLVASTVTDHSRRQLKSFAAGLEDDAVESVEIAVTRRERRSNDWHRVVKRPVVLFRFRKNGA